MDIKAKIFSAVFFVSILVFLLHAFHRWSKRSAEHRIHAIIQNSRPDNFNDSRFIFTPGPDPPSIPRGQLNPSILASLPVLDYAAGAQLIDCAVCLSEFEVGEKIRLLPKCNHSFHIDCIDMWFSSHATCPLCRSQVEKFGAGLGATWRMPFLGMGRRSTVFGPEAGEGTSPGSVELDLESRVDQSTQT